MLQADDLLKARRSLILHEGCRWFPYTDTRGKITIGVGYNLTDRGISQSWVTQQLEEDIQYFYNQLMEYDWYRKLNADRQIAILDASFMGIKTLLGFKRMIAALGDEDYKKASQELLNSNWAKQVGQRSMDLATVIATGNYPI